jgi:type III secretory pathway lipoprotein EscJ
MILKIETKKITKDSIETITYTAISVVDRRDAEIQAFNYSPTSLEETTQGWKCVTKHDGYTLVRTFDVVSN